MFWLLFPCYDIPHVCFLVPVPTQHLRHIPPFMLPPFSGLRSDATCVLAGEFVNAGPHVKSVPEERLPRKERLPCKERPRSVWDALYENVELILSSGKSLDALTDALYRR